MKCPICEQEMETQTYLGEHILEEESGECEDEHHRYSYQYAYGNTTEMIGPVIIHHSYSETKEQREHRLFINKVLTYYEREWYRKQKGGE